MGLILKKNIDRETVLGIWEITEDFDRLFSLTNLDTEDINTVYSFKNKKRKLEWLSVRALLKQLTKNNLKIIYSQHGKPYIEKDIYKIGISHSKNLVSIIISKNKTVSVDIEFISEKIKKLKNRFLNTNEINVIDINNEIYHLNLHWCAKEAIFKICNKQNINFKTNINIKPFIPEEKGSFKGSYNNTIINDEFVLNYFTIKNYSLVYCYK
ncbi:MAG: 4'-phosphopantetheinyl transferase superfamily protein [Bacteroidota bacterium]|nr:4'-phosphopantetheinyl transferase superfamily protein [Bacteroidota bacterium]